MKEALFYTPESSGRVQCFLCAHNCEIAPGHEGLCGARRNSEGKLFSLVYGEVSALALDPVEKKPLFHFLPGTTALSIGTVGCNFKCEFCQNYSLSQAVPESSFFRTMSPEQIVDEALRVGASSIAYTYSEPTIFFEYAYDTGVLARSKGLKNIFVTNGFMGKETYKYFPGFLDAANIDLKSFDEGVYRKTMGGKLFPVLENIRGLHEAGVFIEITTLIVPGMNDSEEELKKIAEFIASVNPEIPWHISRFHPDYKMDNRENTPAGTMQKAVEIGSLAGLKFVYTGNISGEGNENTFCPQCGALLIKRYGYSKPEISMQNNLCHKCMKKIPGLFDTNELP